MNTTFELTGNIVEIMPTQTFNKGFKKREFVIEIEDGRFTQKILLQAVQDKCEMLDSFGEGNTVKVAFNRTSTFSTTPNSFRKKENWLQERANSKRSQLWRRTMIYHFEQNVKWT